MAHIKTEKEYAAIIARVDQLFFETNEDTPSDDAEHTKKNDV